MLSSAQTTKRIFPVWIFTSRRNTSSEKREILLTCTKVCAITIYLMTTRFGVTRPLIGSKISIHRCKQLDRLSTSAENFLISSCTIFWRILPKTSFLSETNETKILIARKDHWRTREKYSISTIILFSS